ncbi:MAG: hypothetical protein ACI37S_02125, partial [Candidatus Gastranaerophilaceae bacterium]
VQTALNKRTQGEQAANNVYEQTITQADQTASEEKAKNEATYKPQVDALEAQKQDAIAAEQEERANSRTGHELAMARDEAKQAYDSAKRAFADYEKLVGENGIIGAGVDKLNAISPFEGVDSVEGYRESIEEMNQLAQQAKKDYDTYIKSGKKPENGTVQLSDEQRYLAGSIRTQSKAFGMQKVVADATISLEVGLAAGGIGEAVAAGTAVTSTAGKVAIELGVDAVVDAGTTAVQELADGNTDGADIANKAAMAAGIGVVGGVASKAVSPVADGAKSLFSRFTKESGETIAKTTAKVSTKTVAESAAKAESKVATNGANGTRKVTSGEIEAASSEYKSAKSAYNSEVQNAEALAQKAKVEADNAASAKQIADNAYNDAKQVTSQTYDNAKKAADAAYDKAKQVANTKGVTDEEVRKAYEAADAEVEQIYKKAESTVNNANKNAEAKAEEAMAAMRKADDADIAAKVAQGDAKILKTNMDDARKNLLSLRYIEAKSNISNFVGASDPAYTLYTEFDSNDSVQDNTVRANSLQNRQDVKIGTKQYVKTRENGQNVYYEINGDKATKIDDKAIASKINKKLEEM